MNDYLLLTPGPLSTSDTVKKAMLKDWCTWDDEYNQGVVQAIRAKLVALATAHPGYTSVLMQGSGTASVESALGSLIKSSDKLLVINNGAYGERIGEIAAYLNINTHIINYTETQLPNVTDIEAVLLNDSDITHIAMVHCETTTGMLNPAEAVGQLAKTYNKVFVLDAMSSFGGIPFDLADWHVDVMISSANKCIQGVPGFGFVICKHHLLAQSEGVSRSLSLDLFAQWHCMEKNNGKWRFTSPTHVVRAFYQALVELEEEGGITERYKRYKENQHILVKGMKKLGFSPLLDTSVHSPIITSFLSPTGQDYDFKTFYNALKNQGFVIYPGKVSDADCFRIGNIGHVFAADMHRLLDAVASNLYWQDTV
ncbi:2-aminoethylphosphonate--pyruvate transaminase [Pseudoalteromonas sp. SG45-5]|uniref:2-aminoethylphosphonate--pyruvate transaminase n=1 Tax=unclassified Pseudoalteromonas TaxID=194690 RepID=UPI0015F913C1|nr:MULTISPECIES: 2-aminoethylphosphonate--pyruvate transaminase [unclassified Pseudoalteromonas]MBB1384881.1 2-aminoethylphosphonate--pyruvate transaminase [Pseudoalteromonas sp. SG45-5]MBB1392723.1 2-aminoethylphosphonate--pyruvate transaminase [Pseudoalteromonas sp. SG44-4]MBB1445649.1 2-aminoethylphosphonate--pyruvate transaminase [Pseudoalteromonas sp. SG41-6]